MKTNKVTVFWSSPAQEDLEAIIEFISMDSSTNARTIFEEIKKNCIKLEIHPHSGRIPPELKAHNIEAYREIIVMHWRLLYRQRNDELDILAVIDSRRDIEDALLERIIRRN